MLYENFLRNRKGVWSSIEVLMIVLLMVVGVMVIVQVQTVAKDLSSFITHASAESVARDVGGLMSISAAAIDEISIDFRSPNKNVVYDIEVEDKVVKVTARDSETLKELNLDPTVLHGYSKIPFDVSIDFKAKSRFLIQKVLDEVGDYKIQMV